MDTEDERPPAPRPRRRRSIQTIIASGAALIAALAIVPGVFGPTFVTDGLVTASGASQKLHNEHWLNGDASFHATYGPESSVNELSGSWPFHVIPYLMIVGLIVAAVFVYLSGGRRSTATAGACCGCLVSKIPPMLSGGDGIDTGVQFAGWCVILAALLALAALCLAIAAAPRSDQRTTPSGGPSGARAYPPRPAPQQQWQSPPGYSH